MKLMLFIFLLSMGQLAAQKKYTTYKVKTGENIESIAKALSISSEDILELNPDVQGQLKANTILIIPNKEFNPADVLAEVDLSFLAERDIIVDRFIYHEIIQGETLYSIEKRYKVSNADLNRFNPKLVEEGLRPGQVIKIPMAIDLDQIEKAQDQLEPYLVRPKETKFSIAKNHGITVAQLEALNPKIKELGLQIDDVIMVPNEDDKLESPYLTHKILKGETLYSIGKYYGVEEEALLELNPQIREGLKEGVLITIPNKTVDSTLFEEPELLGKQLNIALMLPFKKSLDTLDFNNNRLLNVATDFYFGALVAIDSLKNKGLSINAHVYDTDNSPFVSGKLSKGYEFNQLDAIVGPMFLKNLKAVAKSLNGKETLIISPLSAQDHSDINNVNVVQDVPTKQLLSEEMVRYIKDTHKGEKLLIISDVATNVDPKSARWIRELKELDSINEVAVIYPEDGYIKPEVFKEQIKEEELTWVILIGDNEVFMSDVINNVGVLPDTFKVQLFALGLSRNFGKNDNNHLSRVSFHYPAEYYFDHNSKKARNFINHYTKRFNAYPSKYAVEGFDVTYDALIRLAQGADFINQGKSTRLGSAFQFIENTSGSALNAGLFIIRYNGLQLEIVK